MEPQFSKSGDVLVFEKITPRFRHYQHVSENFVTKWSPTSWWRGSSSVTSEPARAGAAAHQAGGERRPRSSSRSSSSTRSRCTGDEEGTSRSSPKGDGKGAGAGATTEPVPYRRGEVVVLVSPENPENRVCKRVVGVPGDWVRVSSTEYFMHSGGSAVGPTSGSSAPPGGREGRVVVHDGARSSSGGGRTRPPGSSGPPPSSMGGGPHPGGRVRVPAGHVWVQGDNKAKSHDSRHYGVVPVGLIEGKVSIRLWPLDWRDPFVRPLLPEDWIRSEDL